MTEELSAKLQRLDAFLMSEAVDDDSMLLSELDGFLAGVIVCPEMIPPSEWLPMIWGEDAPVFDSQAQAQEILGLIMDHYNDLIRELDRNCYRPVYDAEPDGDVLWELWADGFLQAMRLRPQSWEELAESDDESCQNALFILGRLAEIATSPHGIEPIDIDEDLEDLAANLIPLQVQALHHARLSRGPNISMAANQNSPKVGRNDPCPCGSGKKYKKCCLN